MFEKFIEQTSDYTRITMTPTCIIIKGIQSTNSLKSGNGTFNLKVNLKVLCIEYIDTRKNTSNNYLHPSMVIIDART